MHREDNFWNVQYIITFNSCTYIYLLLPPFLPHLFFLDLLPFTLFSVSRLFLLLETDATSALLFYLALLSLSFTSYCCSLDILPEVSTTRFVPSCKNCLLKIGSRFGLLDSNLLQSSWIVDILFPSSGSLRTWCKREREEKGQ